MMSLKMHCFYFFSIFSFHFLLVITKKCKLATAGLKMEENFGWTNELSLSNQTSTYLCICVCQPKNPKIAKKMLSQNFNEEIRKFEELSQNLGVIKWKYRNWLLKDQFWIQYMRFFRNKDFRTNQLLESYYVPYKKKKCFAQKSRSCSKSCNVFELLQTFIKP